MKHDRHTAYVCGLRRSFLVEQGRDDVYVGERLIKAHPIDHVLPAHRPTFAHTVVDNRIESTSGTCVLKTVSTNDEIPDRRVSTQPLQNHGSRGTVYCPRHKLRRYADEVAGFVHVRSLGLQQLPRAYMANEYAGTLQDTKGSTVNALQVVRIKQMEAKTSAHMVSAVDSMALMAR